MPIIIDNIELDEFNLEFSYAADFVKHTDKLVYLTGKAGTGKTTFLKYLRKTTTKNTVVLAPTGVAALNAGGQTIHSFFQIKPSVYVPEDKRLRTKPDLNDADRSTIFDHFKYSKDKKELIKQMELLIIDEVSMVRCDLMDVVDRLLRVFRGIESEPFGGVQVVLIGDTFQLAPIARSDEWEIIKDFYSTEFFFGSKVIENNKPIYIELKKIYRQSEQEFIDLLNRVRINQVTNKEIELLNSKFNPTFSPKENSNYITLATHNRIVDSTNITKLGELKTELKIFEATVIGNFPEDIMPTADILQLKEGAQIMFIRNDIGKRYFNGKIAKIKSIEDDEIIVEFSDGGEIMVEMEEWNNIRYKWNNEEKRIEEEVIGTFIQFPIKLAWAITVHKSQGLTFEKVFADLGASFAPGQVYVALSRCTSFSGLVLKSKISRNAIKTDPQVLLYAQNETPSTLIIKELNSGKADSYYKKVREDVKVLNFSQAYDNFLKAIKLRNDIETDLFKKYLITTTNRLISFKHKYITSLNEFEGLIQKNKELQASLSQLENDNKNQQSKISEQNRATKLLLDKTAELELQIERHKSELLVLTKEKTILEKLIIQYQNSIPEYTKTISVLEAKIRNDKQEIERLKKVKWYQRINRGD